QPPLFVTLCVAFIAETLLTLFMPPPPVCRHVPVEHRVLRCTQYELKALFVLSQLFFCSLAFREIDGKHNRIRGVPGNVPPPIRTGTRFPLCCTYSVSKGVQTSLLMSSWIACVSRYRCSGGVSCPQLSLPSSNSVRL